MDYLNEYQLARAVVSTTNNIAMCFFILELSVRFVCSPNKKLFLRNIFNVIDFISIVLFVVTSAVINIEIGNIGKTGRFVKILRFLRILRFCKLIRHLSSFQILMRVVFEAIIELQFIFVGLIITLVVLSIMIYYAEKDDREENFSFLDCLEWTTNAITTVGTQDGHPVTWLGKCLSGVCVLCGVILFLVPVPLIVNSFSKAYKRRLTYKTHLAR